jgi:excisionase family DNA binding protein
MPTMTIAEAADHFGYTPRSLRLAIRRGKLRYKKVGPLYVVRPQDVQAYIDAERTGPGRPRGPRVTRA